MTVSAVGHEEETVRYLFEEIINKNRGAAPDRLIQPASAWYQGLGLTQDLTELIAQGPDMGLLYTVMATASRKIGWDYTLVFVDVETYNPALAEQPVLYPFLLFFCSEGAIRGWSPLSYNVKEFLGGLGESFSRLAAQLENDRADRESERTTNTLARSAPVHQDEQREEPRGDGSSAVLGTDVQTGKPVTLTQEDRQYAHEYDEMKQRAEAARELVGDLQDPEEVVIALVEDAFYDRNRSVLEAVATTTMAAESSGLDYAYRTSEEPGTVTYDLDHLLVAENSVAVLAGLYVFDDSPPNIYWAQIFEVRDRKVFSCDIRPLHKYSHEELRGAFQKFLRETGLPTAQIRERQRPVRARQCPGCSTAVTRDDQHCSHCGRRLR